MAKQVKIEYIEYDDTGRPVKFYPLTRRKSKANPRLVVVNPSVAFGRPVLRGAGIPTGILAERFKAGESIDELAFDYGISRELIEEAIRFEMR